MAAVIQASIARIHEACQAPPLSPPDYRALFEAIAAEINDNGLQGGQTLASIHTRMQQHGMTISRDDIRFVMEVVSEADPWFEQGASANVFAGRFRNFVVARCRSQGLNLSADELDLIEAWFVSGSVHQQSSPQPAQPPLQQQRAPIQQPGAAPAGFADYAQQGSPDAQSGEDDFPRFVRNRVHG